MIRVHPEGAVQDVGTKSVLVGKSVSVTLTMVGVAVAEGVSVPIDATVNVAVGKSNEMVGGI
jgi:hypothetical protein